MLWKSQFTGILKLKGRSEPPEKMPVLKIASSAIDIEEGTGAA